jgi:hypothetical protein
MGTCASDLRVRLAGTAAPVCCVSAVPVDVRVVGNGFTPLKYTSFARGLRHATWV